jgi:hypothetical protein
MKMLIAVSILAVGFAGLSMPAQAGSGIAGRWRGVLLRDGLPVPIELQVNGIDADLKGRLQAAAGFTPIQAASATLTSVHFEVPGEGIFDGTVAQDSMAGSISGAPVTGSFSLTRESESPFADPITSSGP